MYCKHIGCSRDADWHGTYCADHLTSAQRRNTTKSRPRATAVEADSTQVRGAGVVTARRIQVNRIKSVRRNGPVSYWNMFSEDMLRDMNRPIRRVATLHDTAPIIAPEYHPSLISTLPATNMQNPDA